MIELSWLTHPVSDLCLDCGTLVNPTQDRQELAEDDKGQTRRRCGKCIARRSSLSAAPTAR